MYISTILNDSGISWEYNCGKVEFEYNSFEFLAYPNCNKGATIFCKQYPTKSIDVYNLEQLQKYLRSIAS